VTWRGSPPVRSRLVQSRRDTKHGQARAAPEEDYMPIVTVDLLEGRTVEQKRDLAKAITEAIVNIAKAPRDGTWVVFRDVKKADWATGGKLLSDS
jgi:4-oxalocrotonate tautomerase